jgi:hypothetical protein
MSIDGSTRDSTVAAPRPHCHSPPGAKSQSNNENMIRTILSVAVLGTFAATAVLNGEPSPTNKSSSSKRKRRTAQTVPKLEPVTPLKPGWSLVDGVWTHSDGYQFIKGQVIRVGTQTHKIPPPPPTKAEMAAATKTKNRPKSAAEIESEKAAQRERNLAPRPAPQTGTHL